MNQLRNTSKRFHIEEAVFYITNVCNLTCNNCETFNNKKFKGHFKWESHKDDYYRWSELTSVDLINIHGGEPFTNPDLLLWAENLKILWPNSKFYTISSNGTLLKDNIELTRKLIELGWMIDITVHDPADYDSIISTCEEITSIYNTKCLPKESICRDINQISLEKSFVDNNRRLIINVIPEYYFYKNSSKYTRHGVIFMHNSDVEAAHTRCISIDGKPCRFFVRGKLFKCPLTAISQDLIDQFTIETEATTLLKKYKAASPYDNIDNLDKFFNNLHLPIEQCSLCPESDIRFPIYPIPKKKNS